MTDRGDDHPRREPEWTPLHWRKETSGILAPACRRFLHGEPLSDDDLQLIRTYLRQWMGGPWQGPNIRGLRASLPLLTTRARLEAWTAAALANGIDPF